MRNQVAPVASSEHLESEVFFWTVLSAQRSLQGGHLGILPHAWASGVLHGGGSRSAVRRHGSSQRRRRRTGSVRGPGTKGGISRRGKWLLAPAATVRAPAHQHFTRFSLFNHFISLHSSPSACPTVISVRSFFTVTPTTTVHGAALSSRTSWEDGHVCLRAIWGQPTAAVHRLVS